ncbi:rCG23496, partial [Rattus norvegicus]
MILATTLSLLFAYKNALCVTLTQSSLDQAVVSGSKVTLLCTFDGSSPNPDLFWYRKRPDGSFQFILYRDNSRSHDADFVQGRFSVKHSKADGTFHLVIAPVRLEDSATYYCALGSH